MAFGKNMKRFFLVGGAMASLGIIGKTLSKNEDKIEPLNENPEKNVSAKDMDQADKLKEIQKALGYLDSIPEMKKIFKNLPTDIKYDISRDIPGIANYDVVENSIILNPDNINTNTPRERLNFYLTVAHELCHANQKKEGLYYDDLLEASFGDTFRVAKMMEMETRLFSTTLEHVLLQRPEFADCKPSVACAYYRGKLKEFGNDQSKANEDFIMTYWQAGKNKALDGQPIKDVINSYYFFYFEQGFHQALIMHDPKFGGESTSRTLPSEAISKYLNRMNVSQLNPESFLQNGFDNVSVADNFADGMTILQFDKSKFMRMTPTEDCFWDKVEYFQGDEVVSTFLRHGKTKQMVKVQTVPQMNQNLSFTLDRFSHAVPNLAIQHLSALEIAIENGRMDRIEEIVAEDPEVVNRQMVVGKRFPILMAIQNNNPEAVDFLLKHNPNLLLSTEDHRTVLTELPKLKDSKLQSKVKKMYQAQVEQTNVTHKQR